MTDEARLELVYSVTNMKSRQVELLVLAWKYVVYSSALLEILTRALNIHLDPWLRTFWGSNTS